MFSSVCVILPFSLAFTGAAEEQCAWHWIVTGQRLLKFLEKILADTCHLPSVVGGSPKIGP